MADEEVPQSLPAPNTVELFNAAMDKAEGAPPLDNAQQAPAPAEVPLTFDPATVRIPKDAKLPDYAEKFRDKNLPEVFEITRKTEQWGHDKAQEAAQLRRELEDERTRRISMEQLRSQQPPVQPQDPYAKLGIDPDVAIIGNARQVLDLNRQLSAEDARAIAQQAAKSEADAIRAENQREREANSLIATFETAKDGLRKAGYQVSDEQWLKDLAYIAPAIAREAETNPNALYETRRYMEHFAYLKGAPQKPTIPTEGNPPVAGRPATVAAQPNVPTIAGEMKSKADLIAKALGFSAEDKKAYMARLGGTQ